MNLKSLFDPEKVPLIRLRSDYEAVSNQVERSEDSVMIKAINV